MGLTVDCGEGKHDVCSGSGTSHYLIPQLNDGERFQCSCPCHSRQEQTPEEKREWRRAYRGIDPGEGDPWTKP